MHRWASFYRSFKFLTKIKLCEKICKSFKPSNKPIINIIPIRERNTIKYHVIYVIKILSTKKQWHYEMFCRRWHKYLVVGNLSACYISSLLLLHDSTKKEHPGLLPMIVPRSCHPTCLKLIPFNTEWCLFIIFTWLHNKNAI